MYVSLNPAHAILADPSFTNAVLNGIPFTGCIYRNRITDWFDMEIKKKADFSILHKAVLAGDSEAISEFVNGILEQCISYFDSDESFYHGIFLSMLYGTPGYSVRSNREEGNGRTDIVLYPNRPKVPAILF